MRADGPICSFFLFYPQITCFVSLHSFPIVMLANDDRQHRDARSETNNACKSKCLIAKTKASNASKGTEIYRMLPPSNETHAGACHGLPRNGHTNDLAYA